MAEQVIDVETTGQKVAGASCSESNNTSNNRSNENNNGTKFKSPQ